MFEEYMYTKDNPLRLYERADTVADRNATIDHMFATYGGVDVWESRYIGDASRLITGMGTPCPHWKVGKAPDHTITDRDAIVVHTLLKAHTVTREYIPLDLFVAACQETETTYEIIRRHGSCAVQLDTLGPREKPVWVRIFHEREAHDGNGSRVGTEWYSALLDVVGCSDQPKRTPFSRWLVRVDTFTVKTEHVPEAGECECEEGCGCYTPPEGEFAWQEMESAVRALRARGLHWAFKDGTWTMRDAWDEEVTL